MTYVQHLQLMTLRGFGTFLLLFLYSVLPLSAREWAAKQAEPPVYIPAACLWADSYTNSSESLAMPLKSVRVSSSFGYRRDPFNGRLRFHGGIDLKAVKGDSVYAMLSGKVSSAGWSRSYGRYVTIQHGNFSVRYCHLSKTIAVKGQEVMPGDCIGLVGLTGRATGPHLHLELLRGKKHLNPLPLLKYIIDRVSPWH